MDSNKALTAPIHPHPDLERRLIAVAQAQQLRALRTSEYFVAFEAWDKSGKAPVQTAEDRGYLATLMMIHANWIAQPDAQKRRQILQIPHSAWVGLTADELEVQGILCPAHVRVFQFLKPLPVGAHYTDCTLHAAYVAGPFNLRTAGEENGVFTLLTFLAMQRPDGSQELPCAYFPLEMLMAPDPTECPHWVRIGRGMWNLWSALEQERLYRVRGVHLPAARRDAGKQDRVQRLELSEDWRKVWRRTFEEQSRTQAVQTAPRPAPDPANPGQPTICAVSSCRVRHWVREVNVQLDEDAIDIKQAADGGYLYQVWRAKMAHSRTVVASRPKIVNLRPPGDV